MRPVPAVSQLVRVAEWRWAEPGSAQGRHFGTSPFSASASASACATSPVPVLLKLAPMTSCSKCFLRWQRASTNQEPATACHEAGEVLLVNG